MIHAVSYAAMSDATADPHEEEVIGKVVDARLLARLIRYVIPYRGQALAAASLILLSSLLQLVGPLLIAATVDLFVKPTAQPRAFQRWLGERMGASDLAADPGTGIAYMAAFYLALLVLTFIALYAQSVIMQRMGQRIMYDLRHDVFGRLQQLPVSYLDRNPVGRLVTRVTSDVAALNEVFTAGLVSILGDLVLLFGIMAVLFAIHWPLALVSFSILPLLLLLSRWFKTRARDSYRRVRLWVARINATIQEHVTGMAVVQLFNREAQAVRDFADINREHRDVNIQAINYYAFYYPAVDLVTALGLALIVWYGGGRVLIGTLSFGLLIAFIEYAQRFYRPIADLSEKYNILQGAMASAERIFALLDADPTITSPPDAYRPENIEGTIAFENVTFGYHRDQPVLHDVSFQIAPGETVAIVGHTGAGKSTLTNLLLRFYDVDAGSVAVDGIDVRRWNIPALRRSIAMVLQDVFLFSGSIAGNIRLGSDIDDATLHWAAGEVQATDFIDKLPEGFDTRVRERGAGLSVGQKQLIAFARALAANPRILILDEATASIDTETEQQIQLALDRLLVGRTSLVIAHRLSTIRKADRILVMHKGQLREQGTHGELLAKGGIYQKLYQLQYRDQTTPVYPVPPSPQPEPSP